MSDRTVPSYYIQQKPVFDRELKAPEIREWNMHKDFRDRFERKMEINSNLNKTLGEKMENNFTKTLWKVVGISSLLALITEIVSRLRK